MEFLNLTLFYLTSFIIYVAYIFINIYTQTCKTSWRSTYDFKLMSSDNLGSQIC